MILLCGAPCQLLRTRDVSRGCMGVCDRAPAATYGSLFLRSRIRPLFFLFYHPRVEVAHRQRAKHPYHPILLPHGVRLLAPLYFDLPPARLAYTYHRLWRTCRGCPLWCYPCVKGPYVDFQALLPAHVQLTKYPYNAVRIRNTLYLFIPFRLDDPPARLAPEFFLFFSHINPKSLS